MTDNLQAVLDIAESVVANQSSRRAGKARPLLPDGSSGDPASIGVAVLLANWTGQDGLNYSDAATGQLNYLLNVVPKYENGAISHRTAGAQLWCVLPNIPREACTNNAPSVGVIPSSWFRHFSRTTASSTLTNHSLKKRTTNASSIAMPSETQTTGICGSISLGLATRPQMRVIGPQVRQRSPHSRVSLPLTGAMHTGNGWAAAGMLRVLATIQHSQYSDALSSEMDDLVAWIKEIQGAMYDALVRFPISFNTPH